jgi:hypothetical protein
MPEIMYAFLMNFYGFDAETAREIFAELRDKRSLQNLAFYRVAQSENKPPSTKV